MSYSRDQWWNEIERAEEQLCSGEADEAAFRAMMRSLGFDDEEIDEEILAIREEEEL